MERASPLLCFIMLGMLGCPSLDVTPVEITRIDVTAGEVSSTRFTLAVHGRGFGLGDVKFDTGENAGSADSASNLGFQLSNAAGTARRFGSSFVDVFSPRRLDARVELTAPLPPGRYAFALLRETATETLTLAVRTDIFVVEGPPGPDGGTPGRDAGPNPTADAGLPEAGVPDTGTPDAGIPDSGIPALGPFIGAFQYRAQVIVTATVPAPAGTTVRVPVNHGTLVATGRARADGADVVVAQGSQILNATWDDTAAVNTDAAALIVALAEALPPGGNPERPLLLYYGDPDATFARTDEVFVFAERFEEDPSTQGGTWSTSRWFHCNEQYPIVPGDPVTGNHAYCVFDDAVGLLRASLATPALNLVQAPGPGLVYEMSFHVAATQNANSDDILYLAHFSNNMGFDQTVEFPLSAYAEFVPRDTLTFEDTDNLPRTVTGWRFPPVFEGWPRVRLLFRPVFAPVSFHLRFVSPGGASGLFVALDEWWVRQRIRSVRVDLGPEEAR